MLIYKMDKPPNSKVKSSLQHLVAETLVPTGTWLQNGSVLKVVSFQYRASHPAPLLPRRSSAQPLTRVLSAAAPGPQWRARLGGASWV